MQGRHRMRHAMQPVLSRPTHPNPAPVSHPQVAELKQTIEEVSDGVQSARKPSRPFGSTSMARGGEITISTLEMDGRQQNADYYQHTDEMRAFQQVRGAGRAWRAGCGVTAPACAAAAAAAAAQR